MRAGLKNGSVATFTFVFNRIASIVISICRSVPGLECSVSRLASAIIFFNVGDHVVVVAFPTCRSPAYNGTGTRDAWLGAAGVTAGDILRQLRAAGVEVRAVAGEIQCRPLAAVPAGMLAAIRARKPELLALLSTEARPTCQLCGAVGACRGCPVPLLPGADGNGGRYPAMCIEGPVMDATIVDWERLP